jgi:DNA-binding GntR family transcriptional regulator
MKPVPEIDRGEEDLPRQSLSQDVYDHLLEKFLQNELVPGHILNRREIALQLGVSVAPVLEALLQLEMEGFVESIPRKGTLVKPVRQEDIFGQLMLREAVECQAARLYCGEPVRNARPTLDTLAMDLDATTTESPEHWKQEIDFHSSLVELSECPPLLREFRRFIRLGVFYRLNRILEPVDRLDGRRHIDLLDVLCDDNPDKAERAVRDHLRSGKQRLFTK